MTIEKLIASLKERKLSLLEMMDERSRVYLNPQLDLINCILFDLENILHNQTKPD